MKLLLDENISWRLVSKLKQYFDELQHISFIAINHPATDRQIWNFALENNFIIATNDADFIDLMNLYNFPPKVVLLKTNNQSTNYIFNLIVAEIEEIKRLEQTTEYGLLELF